MSRPPHIAVRYLRDYVAIPSVNPMRGDRVPAEIAGERRYAEHLHAQLRAMGLDAVVIGKGDRASVVAEARPRGATETVLIASHLDTVPVEGMAIDPFDPVIEGDRVYGRGACDTKSGMAAAIAALEALLRSGALKRNIVLVGEADEECGSVGVEDVLEHLGARRPDWILATEPTELRLVTHHKGVGRAHLRAEGVACHSSDPSLGKSAIVEIAKTILALEDLGQVLSRREHPQLGGPTLSVGLVGGGQAANVVPPDAWLHLDRRLVPGETEEVFREEIESMLREAGLDRVRIETVAVEKPSLATAVDSLAVRACQAGLAAIGLDPTPTIAAFGTDAGVFAERGLPGVVFGPGSIARAHTAREYVEIPQVEAATEFFRALLGS
jgi:acetylornithine deacetylase